MNESISAVCSGVFVIWPFFLAISLPALYVALLSFHQELIPFELIVSLAENRKKVPLPVAVEAFLLELLIQITIETGLRLPANLGLTVGVVGGIILGQAAISANLASPAVIIIVSATTMCTFALPTNSMAQVTRILRLPLLILASMFGIFGFSLGWLIILAHLASLESVGVPYFAPFAPTRFADLKDAFFRTSLFKMNQRPVSIPVQDRQRQANTGRRDKNNEKGLRYLGGLMNYYFMSSWQYAAHFTVPRVGRLHQPAPGRGGWVNRTVKGVTF